MDTTVIHTAQEKPYREAGACCLRLLFFTSLFLLLGTILGTAAQNLASTKGVPSYFPQMGKTLIKTQESFSKNTPPPWARDLIDDTIDPCNNFYRYSCGGWINRTEQTGIGHTQYAWGMARDRIAQTMQRFLESDTGAAGILYRSCTDIDTIDDLGSTPYRDSPWPKIVERVDSSKTLVQAVAAIQLIKGSVFWDYQVLPDEDDPTISILLIFPAKLTLDSHYFKETLLAAKVRGRYRDDMVALMTMLGTHRDHAELWANRSIDIETEIALMLPTPEEVRAMRPRELMRQDELLRELPGFRWDVMFDELGIGTVGQHTQQIRLMDLQTMKKLSAMLQSHPAEYFKPYLQWRLMLMLVPHLSEKFSRQRSKMDGDLHGLAVRMHETTPMQVRRAMRGRSCHQTLSVEIPQILSKVYIDKALSAESEHAAKYILHHLRRAFERILKGVDWMTADVKVAALEKLKNMFFEVGHPDSWRDIHLDFTPKSTEWFNNSMRLAQWAVQKQLNKVASKVDRKAWDDIGAMHVNALYEIHRNGIFVPAGIIQSPFFNFLFPLGWNLGALGVIMGHEITHGFDNEGSEFNMDGQRKKWWTQSVRSKFGSRVRCLQEYYSTYTIMGENLNGNMSSAENMADNGGMHIAWSALHEMMSKAEPPLSKAAVRAAEKQFFLAFGQTYCSRPMSWIALAKRDPHAPDPVRVNALLSHFLPFSDTFECKLGTTMNPIERRCNLWPYFTDEHAA